MAMKLKNILIAVVACILTTIVIFTVELFIFGYNKKPQIILSVDSPNRVYNAYVEESHSIDPPNQSLFIAKNGTNEFKLVENLPEDIDKINQIKWSNDSKTVVFTTNWYIIITNAESFNTRKVSLNTDWWKWIKKYGGTFSSSGQTITIEKLDFINSDSLEFKTSIMSQSDTISIADI
jgi:hypothetical protein